MDRNSLYLNELVYAVARTKQEGYSIDNQALSLLGSPIKYSANKTLDKILVIFSNRFGKFNGRFDLSGIKGNCLPVHTFLKGELQKRLNINCLLTIGYVTKSGKDMFKFDSISDLPLGRTIEGKPSHNFHVWITLPSYEILDFTFVAHFAYVNSPTDRQKLLQDAPFYTVNFGDANFLNGEEDMVYHPLYVGEDVLVRNGFKLFI